MTNVEHYSDYKWIKVKRYVMDESKSWEERYKDLDEHHIKETTFLINEVRALAEGLDRFTEPVISDKWMGRGITFFVMLFGFAILVCLIMDAFIDKETQYQNPGLILVALGIGLISSIGFCLLKWKAGLW